MSAARTEGASRGGLGPTPPGTGEPPPTCLRSNSLLLKRNLEKQLTNLHLYTHTHTHTVVGFSLQCHYSTQSSTLTSLRVHHSIFYQRPSHTSLFFYLILLRRSLSSLLASLFYLLVLFSLYIKERKRTMLSGNNTWFSAKNDCTRASD